jgi:hypothetical protein
MGCSGWHRLIRYAESDQGQRSWLAQLDDFGQARCITSALKASDNRFETLVVKMMISAAAVAV